MRKGFTLIEIMVATMLLAMLVTILTMIFNQSSIAWSTGVASVAAVGDAREKMSAFAREADNVILDDRGNAVLGVSSVWDLWQNGTWGTSPGGASRTLRAYADMDEKFREQNVGAGEVRDPMNDMPITVTGGGSARRESFLVGVHSYGPDGKTGGDYSWDDITTMPEEIVK